MADVHPASGLFPDAAPARLREGRRLRSGSPIHPRVTGAERRAALAREQRPFCMLVGCSDSRVPPELLFGRGLGKLFTVRNAGNVVDLAAMGSIEHGVAVLGAPLVVVLCHERCGAVQAAVNAVQHNATSPEQHRPDGQADRPGSAACPVRRRARTAGPFDPAQCSARRGTAAHHGADAVGPRRLGRLRIVGARYDLDDGNVKFLG